MIHSLIDTDIGSEEFALMKDQTHFEKVWAVVAGEVEKYAVSYFSAACRQAGGSTPQAGMRIYLQGLLTEHGKLQDQYQNIFSLDLMEEYLEDPDGFKGSILGKQCPVIYRTLNSRADYLKTWKIAYRLATPAELTDTFYNMIDFAEAYSEDYPEAAYADVDTIDEIRLGEMEEEACYLAGVVGTGILSTILNTIYPRLFPGQFKMGLFSLYILAQKQALGMASGTSEFLMVKDDIPSKTGTYETENNYYYPYETFALYSLRIYRRLAQILKEQFEYSYPTEFRFALVNDFFQFVAEENKETIINLLGNDDAQKFGFSAV